MFWGIDYSLLSQYENLWRMSTFTVYSTIYFILMLQGFKFPTMMQEDLIHVFLVFSETLVFPAILDVLLTSRRKILIRLEPREQAGW